MTTVPPAHTFAWTTVLALRDLGGSGSIEEINERAVALRGLTEEQQALPRAGSSRTEVEYRLAWARTLAKELGLITNSSRGVWALTDLGRTADERQVAGLKRTRSQRIAAERSDRAKGSPPSADDEPPVEDLDDAIEREEQDWKTEVLDALVSMSPDGFERLAKRLLREAGFVNVEVTGRSGDGGIDGLGIYRLSLVSFPVFFQCKRYRGVVRAPDVRDFRGALAGRGDKGLLITTGRFTSDAKVEATRAGAQPIDLIDGDRLADLLREYGLGVRSAPRTVYDVTVEPAFFQSV